MAHVANARNGLSVGASHGARSAYEMHSSIADEVRQSCETSAWDLCLTQLESASRTQLFGDI